MKLLATLPILCLLVMFESGSVVASSSIAVTKLGCEYRANPLGLDITAPRLSWILQSDKRGQKQTAYRILVTDNREKLNANVGDLWDSGRVESDQTINIAYAGKSLTSCQRCFWKVRIWDQDGNASAWSEPARWTMGLLALHDWKARWIAHPSDATVNETWPMPATMLRKEFSVNGPIQRATVYVSGLGLYELHLNGQRVGDHILAPEFTVYDQRIQYQAFDVTDQVAAGRNAVGAMLTDGWHGEYFFGMPMRQAQRPFQGRRGFILQLEIERRDGTVQTIVTDDTWRATRDGPIRSASLYDGEVYDARWEMPGWEKAEFDDILWHRAILADYFKDANLVWQRNEPICVVKELLPVRMTEPQTNLFIFDLGQNMVGRCRIKVRGRAGTTITLRHGEMLNEDGTLYTANLRGAEQADRFTKRTNDEEVYEPRFTYHGFRYIELTGVEYKPWRYMPPYRPKPNDLTGQVFNSVAPEAGRFECSNDRINKLMEAILWTQRGNLQSVPTDCPQRDERAGYLGDIQSFAQTAIFNMDMAGFFAKWLQDLRDSRKEDGRLPNFAPMDLSRWAGGTPAWADAGVAMPWLLYVNYGDIRIIEQHYEAARSWVDYVHRKNPNLRWEKALGSKYNDWLNADTIKAQDWPATGGEVPPPVLATAFFAHSAETVAKMATALNLVDEAAKYRSLFEGIKAAFNENYVQPDGRMEGNTQAGYALALQFNLLPDDLRSKASQHLVENFKRYNGHLSTGIHTTHRLMLELTRNGWTEEAYRLINLRTFPSWGFMLDQGATTSTQRRDADATPRRVPAPNTNTHNHTPSRSGGEGMWRAIIRINPDEAQPGYKHFTITPEPGGNLTWAKGEYKSMRGLIISHWRLEDSKFQLDVTVPVNTTATVLLPVNDSQCINIDGKPAIKSQLTRFLGVRNGKAAFAVKSGQYQFSSSLTRPAEVYTANPNPPTDGLVGANYTPAYAVNQVQFWHDFRSEVVEKELAAAREHFGISTLRVFLHNINFDQEKAVFLANLDKFLTICDQHGIRPGFVFFDDCHRDDGIFLDTPTTPVKGFHNGRWAQCPQKRDRDPQNLEKFKPYVQEIVRAHRTDRRVLFWEIFNEPAPRADYSRRLSVACYQWAKEMQPVQPVLNCHKSRAGWGDTDVTDIVDAHLYQSDPPAWDRMADANASKGTVITEAGARWYGPRRNFGEPCGVIHWLNNRRAAGRSTPGVYLCWELMVGNSNCRWHWVDKPGTPEPTMPWCGLLWPDGTPVSFAESEAIRGYATGQSRALFFDDFQNAPTPLSRSGWTAYGMGNPGGSGCLSLEPGLKMIAGRTNWTDYVIEALVMLKANTRGNAGLVFRVNAPGSGHDQMRGYYVGFDTNKLYLGKMNNNWQPLAEFDLAKLDCKVVPGVWNQIRVAAEGPRIRVWFNRMHPSADPDRGLRIDVTDKQNPILAGAIGVRAHLLPAWFDNLVVLPSEALPQSSISRVRTAHDWEQSFKPGMANASSDQPMGGTEIVHLAAHKGRLYAGNGYWMDPRAPNVPWAQVLVLKDRDDAWEVDLALGPRHLRVTALKSITFTTDSEGKSLSSPVNLLLAASDSQGESHIWTRDDHRNTWTKTTLPGDPKFRRSTRALIVHRDQVTGVDRIFVAAGALGIYGGAYDPAHPGKIRWDPHAELGPLKIRPMYFAEANGHLYASAGTAVYRRTDGVSPRWEKVYSDNTPEHWELGGIRGLTAVPSPSGSVQSLLFSHTDRIIRLDPDESYRATVELQIRPLLEQSWGIPVPGSIIAAYSDMLPLTDPTTGRTAYIMGVQGRIQRGGKEKRYRPDTFNGWYAGGSYLIRDSDRRYRLKEVNERSAPGKPKLVAPRTMEVSPFHQDTGAYVYFGGFDANFFPARDTAWIFRASTETVLDTNR